MSDSTPSAAAVAAPVRSFAGAPAPGTAAAPVHSPWDGSIAAMVAQAGPADVEAALAAATARCRSRRAAALAPRRHPRRRSRRASTRGRPSWRRCCWRRHGKTIRETRLEVAADRRHPAVRAEAATRIVGEVLPLDAMPGADGRIGMTVAEPVGVVAAIPAYNFPLLIAAHKLGPAIGAGCPVVIKPPEQTPLAILALATEAIAAGWPAAALSVLPGPAEVARALTEDPRVALISFTGSSAVGRLVSRQSA